MDHNVECTLESVFNCRPTRRQYRKRTSLHKILANGFYSKSDWISPVRVGRGSHKLHDICLLMVLLRAGTCISLWFRMQISCISSHSSAHNTVEASLIWWKLPASISWPVMGCSGAARITTQLTQLKIHKVASSCWSRGNDCNASCPDTNVKIHYYGGKVS